VLADELASLIHCCHTRHVEAESVQVIALPNGHARTAMHALETLAAYPLPAVKLRDDAWFLAACVALPFTLVGLQHLFLYRAEPLARGA